MASIRESKVVVVDPSLLGAAPLGSVTSTVVAAAAALAVIPVATAEVTSEVTLASPPPLAVAEEERETRFLASPGRALHGSPSQSTLEVSRGDAAETKPECLLVACETKVVEIPSDDEADDEVEPPVLSWEQAVVRSKAGPSSRLEETDLVWPCPEDPTKVRFILQDSQEC